ncbi:MAG: membrane integrity-associated transporter subunit PqiC [Desulfococcaceae bacterium]
MKKNMMHRAGQAFLLILSLVLTGCFGNTPPVQFYTLTTLAESSAAGHGERYGKPFSVGVGPLEIPKVLDRSQIVTRSDENRIQMAEFQRWGGTLSDDFLRVLAENLSVLLKSEQVLAYPWRDFFDPDFRINLKVHQFDAQQGGDAVLSVTWSLNDAKNRNVLHKSMLREPVSGNQYTDIVSAQSRLLLRLSQEITEEILKQKP